MQKAVARKTAKKLDNNFRVLCLFCAHKAETNTVLALTSFLMAVGFLFGDGVNQNYALLYEVLPALTWSVLFSLYSGVKVATCISKINDTFKYLNSILGMWLWTTVFLSFVVYDETAMTPAELILLMPILTEVWVLLSVFDFAAERDVGQIRDRSIKRDWVKGIILFNKGLDKGLDRERRPKGNDAE